MNLKELIKANELNQEMVKCADIIEMVKGINITSFIGITLEITISVDDRCNEGDYNKIELLNDIPINKNLLDFIYVAYEEKLKYLTKHFEAL